MSLISPGNFFFLSCGYTHSPEHEKYSPETVSEEIESGCLLAFPECRASRVETHEEETAFRNLLLAQRLLLSSFPFSRLFPGFCFLLKTFLAQHHLAPTVT